MLAHNKIKIKIVVVTKARLVSILSPEEAVVT